MAQERRIYRCEAALAFCAGVREAMAWPSAKAAGDADGVCVSPVLERRLLKNPHAAALAAPAAEEMTVETDDT